jgi:hypothetical protein
VVLVKRREMRVNEAQGTEQGGEEYVGLRVKDERWKVESDQLKVQANLEVAAMPFIIRALIHRESPELGSGSSAVD